MKVQGGVPMIFAYDSPVFDIIGVMLLLALPVGLVKFYIFLFKNSFKELERRRRVKEIERDIEELKKSFH
jgi:hypothetical protein